MKKLITLVFMLTISQSLLAANTSKQDWMDNVHKTLPPLLCEENKYFMQCFANTKQECLETTQLFVKACLNNIALGLPENLSQMQGEHWGQMVGRCAYDLNEKFNVSKKRSLANCQ